VACEACCGRRSTRRRPHPPAAQGSSRMCRVLDPGHPPALRAGPSTSAARSPHRARRSPVQRAGWRVELFERVETGRCSGRNSGSLARLARSGRRPARSSGTSSRIASMPTTSSRWPRQSGTCRCGSAASACHWFRVGPPGQASRSAGARSSTREPGSSPARRWSTSSRSAVTRGR
jgi:hypothetical protein